MKTSLFVNLSILLAAILTAPLHGQITVLPEQQIRLEPDMFQVEDPSDVATLIDEQDEGADPRMSSARSMWNPPNVGRDDYPLELVVDLGKPRHLSNILFWDSKGHGVIRVYAGDPAKPEEWKEILIEDGVGINLWKDHKDLNVKTRYLRIVNENGAGEFGEMLVYEYTPEQAAAALERQRKAEREKAMLVTAKEEAKKRPLVDSGTLFGKLPLVDEINVGEDPGERTFIEHPEGISEVQTILGRKARIIPDEQEHGSYYAYHVGEGKLIEPGKAYLLTVDFPEDVSRTFTISNRGGDMVRGIQTGQSLGDSIFGHTSTNLESLQIPLSGQYETFQQLFWLNDAFAGIKYPRRSTEERKFSPVGGFLVIVSQWASNQTPESEGAAVSRIRLFEVPDPAAHYVKLRLPPGDLPHRALFYREEMGDGVVNSREPNERSVANIEEWYLYHFRMMNFLGMNTFAKDLLEFGAPQHWDVENGAWYHQSRFPEVWANILPVATEHGLNVLPYYEYAGSSGSQGLSKRTAELVQPLYGKGPYTHIKWAESKKVDLTDPIVLDEFKRVLELTILKHKDKANFLGAWIRPRIAQMPISFADPTRARFAKEANDGVEVSREELQADSDLLEKYYAWWNDKRKDFLIAVRDFLKENGVSENPLVFFTAYHAEPAPSFPSIRGKQLPIVTDDVPLWEKAIALPIEDYDRLVVLSEDEVRNGLLYQEALLSPVRSWGSWEWHHAARRPDPKNYEDVTGVLMTYPFNRLFTVNTPETLELFTSKSGLAMIRHYPLNENTMDRVLGYFVTDVDRPGSYGMLAEALAVANGDPWYIGYASGHIYNRPFPDAVRRFNANFLALPALPSTRLDEASKDQDIVVREIDAGSHGAYYAIVNTARERKEGVTIQLPRRGKITEAASGSLVVQDGNSLTVSLDPYELRSLQVQ